MLDEHPQPFFLIFFLNLVENFLLSHKLSVSLTPACVKCNVRYGSTGSVMVKIDLFD